MLLVLVAAPLLGSLFALLAGNSGGGGFRGGVAGGSAGLLALVFLIGDGHWTPHVLLGGPAWFTLAALDVDWGLELDSLNLPIVAAVMGVSWVVIVYSRWYIANEAHVVYFLALVQGFVFFMAVLLLGDSTSCMFLGWEGIGVVSFMLIAFWQTRALAAQAAIHGFVANRAGDLFFILVLVGTISSCATVDLTSPLDPGSIVQPYISFLLLGGAAGKSAQLGLHSWLPLAIEAPTPISALIHAATLVTAGVYLLVRLLPLTPGGGDGILLVSAATLLLAGLTGLAQTDLKRTIAFSTCSQVAYMILGVGNGSPSMGMFLLFTHALYKALLFISAGVVIHAAGNVQDIRLMGGNALVLPLSKEFFGGASLSLCAFPHTAGDFSKDLLVEELGYSFIALHQGFWLCGLGGTLLTGAYSGRLWRLTFAAEPRGVSPLSQHEPPSYLSVLLVQLAAVSTLSGWLALELSGASPLSSEETYFLNAEQALSSSSSALPVLCVSGGLLLGFQSSQLTAHFHPLAFNQAIWDLSAPRLLAAGALRFSRTAHKTLDQGAWELIGPVGLSAALWPPSTRTMNQYTQTHLFLLLLSLTPFLLL